MVMHKNRDLHPFDSWLKSEPSKKWKHIGLTGLIGSSKAYILSHWREQMEGPLVIVVPHLRNAVMAASVRQIPAAHLFLQLFA